MYTLFFKYWNISDQISWHCDEIFALKVNLNSINFFLHRVYCFKTFSRIRATKLYKRVWTKSFRMHSLKSGMIIILLSVLWTMQCNSCFFSQRRTNSAKPRPELEAKENVPARVDKQPDKSILKVNVFKSVNKNN